MYYVVSHIHIHSSCVYVYYAYKLTMLNLDNGGTVNDDNNIQWVARFILISFEHKVEEKKN